MKTIKAPGFAAYAAIFLWFLLAVMSPLGANASEASVALRVSDIMPSIEAALMEKGAASNAEIAFADPNAVLVVEPGAEPVFESVSFNAASGRFLIRARGAGDSPTLAIAGFAKSPAEFPVLITPLGRGDIITEDNIAWIETADARPADFITSLDKLVGMEARRPLRASFPLRELDVLAPVLVQKGALVTMTYSAMGVTLTHAGIAKSAGAKGDFIDVENVKSERVVKAYIAGDNLVAVGSPRLASLEQ